MLQPCVVFPNEDDPHPEALITRIVYNPELDGFFVQQGDDVTPDPERPIEGGIFLSLQQIVTLTDIVFGSENFSNAVALARNDFTGKHFH